MTYTKHILQNEADKIIRERSMSIILLIFMSDIFCSYISDEDVYFYY